MATPAPASHSGGVRLTAAPGPAEPVPVAFIGRTSTLEMQDPRASLRRQLRACQDWLPPGWFIAAVYWDIESGGLDLEQRSQGTSYQAFTAAGIPRDGGMADLLTEAASPVPKFAAAVCEDIERSGRDTFNALKLEKKLSRQGIPLFATDEPAVIDGVNATTVLVRRVKQGVAEWFRLQLKEKTWKGLVEHSLDGWNIGPAPYGYVADRIPHPVPVKASQGRTKTRLALDPTRAAVVEQVFTWRVVHKLGMPTIAAKLNADPARYPAPGRVGWTTQSVHALLDNPKYTGHMVYGRIRTRNGHRVSVPADQWLWSPEPTHPPIIDRATWDAAQGIGAEHGTSRDGTGLNTHPAATRTYPYRGRCRCRDCRRRMGGQAYGPAQTVYYQCPYKTARASDTASYPGHPRTVKAPETRLDEIVSLFFTTHVFGPGRAALLAAQLPATDQAAAADRDTQTAALQSRLKRIETAQNSCILELEQLPADPANTASAAMRTRIRARFADLHTERERIGTQLQALAQAIPKAADTTLLAELPLAGDILPGLDPALKAALFDAFDLQILWDKTGGQATVHAEITEATLQALPGILNPGQDGYDDTSASIPGQDPAVEDLFESPIVHKILPEAQILQDLFPGRVRVGQGCGGSDGSGGWGHCTHASELDRRFDREPPRGPVFTPGRWQGLAGSPARPGSTAIPLAMRRLGPCRGRNFMILNSSGQIRPELFVIVEGASLCWDGRVSRGRRDLCDQGGPGRSHGWNRKTRRGRKGGVFVIAAMSGPSADWDSCARSWSSCSTGFRLMVRASSGLRLAPDSDLRQIGRPDRGAEIGPEMLIVPGGAGSRRADPDLVAWLRTHGRGAKRLISVCTGAFLLAEAGLLDGRKVTTHWAYCAALAARFPALMVDPDPIFVRDGHVATSAGVTAGIDLALALVEEDLGREAALDIARHLVVFLRRPGHQAQFSAQLAGQLANRGPLRDVQQWIAEHPAADLSVPTLASQASLSPRQFARAFAAEVGMPPGRYVDRVRLETRLHPHPRRQPRGVPPPLSPRAHPRRNEGASCRSPSCSLTGSPRSTRSVPTRC